jgi:hypothetical protein
MVFFFFFLFFYFLKKKDAKRKCLKQKGRNKKAKPRTKNEWVEREFEGKLPPFFAFFFFFMVFYPLCFFFFLCLRRRKCQEKAFETKVQEREGRSGSQK